MTSTFCRYDLRTNDVDSARSFYGNALALDFTKDGSIIGVWPLHEQARARGAPAHWLGHIAVGNVAATVQQLLARGSQLLGPPLLRAEDGEAFAILRDPCGAVVAVRESSRTANHEPVAWHQLHTPDLNRSWTVYSELFGWLHTRTVEIDESVGELRIFRWNGAGKDVGSIANTARLPGIHPHWLFFFSVADLDVAITEVTAHGGRALAPILLPNGDRVVACEDPQGAAFGLVQHVQHAHPSLTHSAQHRQQ